ncbi:MAG TPA: 23S rRNA (adenine(2503)-C(2))-methyltransferase RlmN [Candidatus Polarisedimenticolia bacterium]|nr:23S rRNA (adenine(2503)-C(2))-methyltransferase RlmN [Candidatus Polarisedimenticolia bacterium]
MGPAKSAVTAPVPSQTNLYGMDRAELASALSALTTRPFHAAQIYRWIYGRRQTNLQAMTDLPAALRRALAERFHVSWPTPREVRDSSDGSRKYVLELEGGGEIEAVYMIQGRRVTLCLSSQIGCPLACRFCLTGTMGLVRNLTPGEIVGQAAVLAQDNQVDPDTCRIVFMGMGEPLNNYDAVLRAFRILVDRQGLRLAPRRVTLSTAGLVPGIERLAGEKPRPRLAVSLAATDDARRDDLMPINRKYDLEQLMAACRAFPLAPRERVTFEYVLLEGMNDTDGDAARMARLLRGVRAKVNLIPYNEAGITGFRTPGPERAARFRDSLLARGVPSSIRWSKGRDIGAACGQLVRAPTSVAPPA